MVKPVRIDKFEELKVFSFPARVSNVLCIVFFSLIFSYLIAVIRVMGAGGFVWTIMLTYASLMFFFGYLFVIVDYTAKGFQEIPRLSASLYESAKPRMFKEAILISFFISLLFLYDNVYFRVVFACSSLMLFPLATSVIIMEESLVSALNPLKWFRVLMDIEADKFFGQYLAIQAIAIGTGYVAFFVDIAWFNFFPMAIFVSMIMMLFRSLGVVLHSNADSLGFPVQFGRQVEEEQILLAMDRELSDFSLLLYKLVNSGESNKAWPLLEKRLAGDNYETEADLFGRFRAWESPLFAVRAGKGFIGRLVAREDFRTAWNILEYCHSNDGDNYTLPFAETVIELLSNAESLRHKSIMVSILGHFEEDFPGHPQTEGVLLTAAKMTAQDLDDFARARKMMMDLRSRHPSVQGNESYQALSALLGMGSV